MRECLQINFRFSRTGYAMQKKCARRIFRVHRLRDFAERLRLCRIQYDILRR